MTAKRPSRALKEAATPLGRRARNKRDKLNRIKSAARKLFVSKGFDDATLREIAARAGVGLGTVFLYAANKRDLLFLIVNEGLEDAIAAGQAAVQPDAPLLDNLVAVFRQQYIFFARQPILSRLVLREMTFYESGAQARAFQATRDALMALIDNIVMQAMQQDRIAATETPQLVGWTIFCIFQVELRRWVAAGDLDLRRGLNRLRRTLNVCITGLSPAKPAPSRQARRTRRPRAAASAIPRAG